MIELVPIAVTKVDWSRYQKAIQGLLQRSVTKTIDQLGIKPDSTKAYLATLSEFQSKGSKPTYDGTLLQHVSITFLAIGPFDLLADIAFTSDLSVLTCESDKIFLISGTLEQWQQAIINGCSSGSSIDLRRFFNRALDRFVQLDLKVAFQECYRRNQTDGTFLLECK